MEPQLLSLVDEVLIHEVLARLSLPSLLVLCSTCHFFHGFKSRLVVLSLLRPMTYGGFMESCGEFGENGLLRWAFYLRFPRFSLKRMVKYPSYKRVICGCAKSGNIEMRKWVVAYCSDPSSAQSFDNDSALQTEETLLAAMGGHIPYILDRFHTLKASNSIRSVGVSPILDGSFRGGRLDVIHWLESFNKEVVRMDQSQFDAFGAQAIRYNNLDCLKYYHNKGFKLNNHLLNFYAARSGSMEAVKWLIENGCEFDWLDFLTSATQSGNLSLLDRLVSNKYNIPMGYCAKKALSFGKIPLLDWLITKSYAFGPESYSEALNSLKFASVTYWLLAKNAPCDFDALRAKMLMKVRLYKEHDQLLRLWANLDPKFKIVACPTAARVKSFFLIPTLVNSYNCELNEETLLEAVSGQCPKTIEFCLIHGVYLTPQALQVAVDNKLWSMATFLLKKGCKWPGFMATTLILSGNLQRIEWAWERLCPFPPCSWLALDHYRESFNKGPELAIITGPYGALEHVVGYSAAFGKEPLALPSDIEHFLLRIECPRPSKTEFYE